jgi:menaquinol-cytochrome c reductase iron-sulfur subunit
MESKSSEGQVGLLGGGRRSFLGALLGVAWAFIGSLLGIPVLRYIFYPVTAKSEDSDWAEAGSIGMLANARAPQRCTLDLKQRDGWRETESAPVVYVVNTAGQMRALSAVCPHLGCTVPWDADRNAFVCPCHGGIFSADGSRLAGPPPRSLDLLESKVAGGKLMVRYQYFRPDVANKEVTS